MLAALNMQREGRRKIVTADPLNPPKGWSYGYCVDDNRVYFIRLNRSRVLEKLSEEKRRRILREWGELEVRSEIIDYETGVVLVPPQAKRLEMPHFCFARKERWEDCLVVFGGELVDR